MAGDLLDRKMKHIMSTGADVVATGNPGCLLQIMNGARKEGYPLRVVHPVTLLAEAIGNPSSRTVDYSLIGKIKWAVALSYRGCQMR
jgi:hypothetical protein